MDLLIYILNIFYETFCWILMRKLYSVWCSLPEKKVTTILIFVLCVHKKIWVCHKTSSMSNLNNVYARSLQHVKFGRTPCNFIFMRNHVFFFHSWDVAAAVSRYLIIITGSFLYMVTRVSHTSFREGPEGKGEIFCAASLTWVQKWSFKLAFFIIIYSFSTNKTSFCDILVICHLKGSEKTWEIKHKSTKKLGLKNPSV